ncbi:MAG: IS3 family transposase [Gaiellaceae bacterium]
MSAFIDRERGRFGVEPICRELEVSSRAYRERRLGRLSPRARRDRVVVEEIRRIHTESRETYGSWRAWKQLRQDGIPVARCTVERLMREHGLVGVVRGQTQRTTVPGATPVPAGDLVKRRFLASRPDELWVCDFTYVRTWEGWAYLALVLDVYTRRIVGWQLAPHMRESLVDDALQMAIAGRTHARGPLVAHTDNGSQYTAWGYSQRLRDAGIAASRGRTGTALDNAMAESVIATVKSELTGRQPWRTRLDLEFALLTYIGWYNQRRLHRSLGGRTPDQVAAAYRPAVTESDEQIRTKTN